MFQRKSRTGSHESISSYPESLDLGSSESLSSRDSTGLDAPSSVTCFLHITFDGATIPFAMNDLRIAYREVDSYDMIERIAQDYIQKTCSEGLAVRRLSFKYGNCTIKGEHVEKLGIPLTTTEDWANVCLILSRLWTLKPRRALEIHIFRDYFSHRSPSSSKVSVSSTQRLELQKLMKRAADGRKYIPRLALMRFTSENNIRKVINHDSRLTLDKETKDRFIVKVQETAPCLFALYIYAGLSMNCLMRQVDIGYNDGRLPLDEDDCCHPNCAADFESLLDKQGGFLAARFDHIGEHQVFDSRVVIPIHFFPVDEDGIDFVKEGRRKDMEYDIPYAFDSYSPERQNAWCGSGAYSNVYRVRIDPDHHRLSRYRDADFALKEFKDRPRRVDADFMRELNILNELRKLSAQKHIVIHLATWTQDGRYCMLFPYAECNLRQYMKSTPFGTPTKERILWLLRQFRGLAQALNNVHNLSVAEISPLSSSFGLQSPGMRKAGYHHDLKPENILHFPNPNSKYGTFKLADFGSGRINTYRSGSKNTPSPSGTLTYEPPEAKTEGVTSRPYDLWSLGCVFLELLTWAVFDHQSVKNFADDRLARRCPDSQTDHIIDDGFWQIGKDGDVTLRAPVHTCIRRLREDFLRGNVPRQRQQCFKAVLELVIRMLEPERLKRITALEVWNVLDNIYKQTKLDFGKMANIYLSRPSESAGAGFVVHSSIKYTLVTNLAPSRTKFTHSNDLKVSLHDPDSYQEIEERAQHCVKDVHGKEIGQKDLLFRYGDCTLIGEKKFRSRLPLRLPEEWVEICKAILSYQAANASESLHLIILREYALCQYRATEDLSLIAAKSVEIHDLRKRAWGRSPGKPYIPHTDLKKVILPSMLPEIINEGLTQKLDADQKDALIQHLQSKCMILLAMFVYTNNQNPLDCLMTLLDKGYCDAKLSHQPLTEDDICHRRCKKRFDRLLDQQGGYIAAQFNKLGEHQVFHHHIVVPIHFCPMDEDSDGPDSELAHEERDRKQITHSRQTDPKQRAFCGEGAYSKVYRVRLDPNHHNLARDKDAYFALKEFRNRPDKVSSDFNKELKFLNELRKYGHPHIVTHLATWTQDETYCMLFPYAQCNLRQYMCQKEFHGRKEDILWFLEQLHGLASALKRIYDLTIEDDLAEPSSPMLQPPSPVLPGERRAGWHHDLKPENILFFWHTDPPRGNFRISDWGSGKANTYRSGSINTPSPTGTPTYEPPEVIVEERTSRPYDVWSLGCVFLELLVWALVDYEAVKKLKKDRFGRRDLSSANSREDDAFWQRTASQRIVLRKAVLECISYLEDRIQRLQRLKSFQAVVDLIKTMLNVNRETRIEAINVEDTLSRICLRTRMELEDSDPAATENDPAIPRLSLKAPDNPPRAKRLKTRSASPAYGPFVSSPLDVYSERGLHSRDTSATDALSPYIVTRSRNTSNASSTMSFRDSKTGPSKASSPEPAEEPN